ncbi:hypothetical protein DPEC_G00179740 [Dallia pectoralis]|uniref:Uncharacterized protein n=1 Tax=Dallia pectoralis TaxID=75939 RepID=A0ACC2GFT6_DALPE|nr:hypothetical protein DPEC_G00179740 [Dallia pectoralis]
MDVYDPQTLGFMVFGGFMVVSALGIVLVSTLSMKETSYEEALAKQRGNHGPSAQPQLSAKIKKKLKSLDIKSKGKKREEQPNGKLPDMEIFDEPVESASEPEPEPVATLEPNIAVPEPLMVACAAPSSVSVDAPVANPSPKEKKKKVAKVVPATKAPAPVAVAETVVKEFSIMAVPPVATVTTAPPLVSRGAPTVILTKAQIEAPTKKKKAKAKVETVMVTMDSSDAPLIMPYNTLLSTVSSTTFSERETQKLIEVLNEKAGRDSWQLASQRGDPVVALRKQLEEKEKRLSTEQEEAIAAKTRLKELSKELNAEKTKLASVETRLTSALSARDQEITAIQTRMQTSYQDHVTETQKLNQKIASLQEQLDNGPVVQLACLQQENSILRDALNQATSQAESRQNAELAKLRQDCVRLNRDLRERTEALQTDEESRKVLQAKVAAAEEKLIQSQISQTESERDMQKRLEEACQKLQKSQEESQKRLEEACQKLQKSQEESKLMQVQLREAQQKEAAFTVLEVQLKNQCAEVEILKTQQAIMSAAKEEAVLLATALKDSAEVQETRIQADNCAEIEELKNRVNEEVEQSPVKEQLGQKDNSAEIKLLQDSLKEKQDTVKFLEDQLRTVTAEMELMGTNSAGSRADVEQLQIRLMNRESHVASLEEQLKQLSLEMEQMKSTYRELGCETEAEQPFESLEKDSQMLNLEEEIEQLKEEVEQVKNKSNEKNWAAMEALTAAEKLNEGRLSEAKSAQRIAEEALWKFQTEAQRALHIYCPDISLEQNNWLEQLIQKAKTSENPQRLEDQQNTDSEELLSNLREAEESQKTLQAECEQYRSVLAETEGMLKDLQKSVEDEEHVWKAKITEAEVQRQAALDQVKQLEQAAEDMKIEDKSTDQLKTQVMLLEAQLEKQLESISISQTCAEETAQLNALLKKTQSQLEITLLDAQRQAAELSAVRQQLSEAKKSAPIKEDRDSTQVRVYDRDSTQVQSQLEQTTNKLLMEEEMRQQPGNDFDQEEPEGTSV